MEYIIVILFFGLVGAALFGFRWLMSKAAEKAQSAIGQGVRTLANKDRAALAKSLRNEILSFYTSLTDEQVIIEIQKRYPMEPVENCPLITAVPTLYIAEAKPTNMVISVNRDAGLVALQAETQAPGKTHITFAVVEYYDDSGAPRGFRKMEALIQQIIGICQQYPAQGV
ncbi:MAG: hypothetical protein Q4P66_03420 [Actinomycetaceae bacterium]|nr:hypothetical protein [Actinomycetaceae bacterium]